MGLAILVSQRHSKCPPATCVLLEEHSSCFVMLVGRISLEISHRRHVSLYLAMTSTLYNQELGRQKLVWVSFVLTSMYTRFMNWHDCGGREPNLENCWFPELNFLMGNFCC